MKKLFGYFLNFYSIIFFVFTLISFLYYFLIEEESLAIAFIHAYLFWNIGVRGIIAFIANTYPPTAVKVAQAYDWHDVSMQQELAAHSGTIGLLGILCIWFDGLFWLATLIGGTVICIISEIGNLTSIFKKENHPFSTKENTPSYVINIMLFIGMHLDLVIAVFALILGLSVLLPKS